MAERVFIATRDLLFRSKLGRVVAAAGGELTADEATCDLAVVSVEDPGRLDGIGALVGRGVGVLAYGSHVRADLLRAARAAGATAVPNSQVEGALRDWLNTQGRGTPRP
jgi:hypothetical protein